MGDYLYESRIKPLLSGIQGFWLPSDLNQCHPKKQLLQAEVSICPAGSGRFFHLAFSGLPKQTVQPVEMTTHAPHELCNQRVLSLAYLVAYEETSTACAVTFKTLTTSKYFWSTGRKLLPFSTNQLLVRRAVFSPWALMTSIAVMTSGNGCTSEPWILESNSAMSTSFLLTLLITLANSSANSSGSRVPHSNWAHGPA